jgi:hypothetical protein
MLNGLERRCRYELSQEKAIAARSIDFPGDGAGSAFAQFPSRSGLSRPSTSFPLRTLQGVDARDKPGQDER